MSPHAVVLSSSLSICRARLRVYRPKLKKSHLVDNLNGAALSLLHPAPSNLVGSESDPRHQLYCKSKKLITNHTGNAKKVAANLNQPLNLLRRADNSHVRSLPLFWSMAAGSEPHAISVSMRNFSGELRKRGGTVDQFVLDGHDPVLALSSGSGEDWGYN